jgi:C4-type Zn-finger protein
MMYRINLLLKNYKGVKNENINKIAKALKMNKELIVEKETLNLIVDTPKPESFMDSGSRSSSCFPTFEEFDFPNSSNIGIPVLNTYISSGQEAIITSISAEITLLKKILLELEQAEKSADFRQNTNFFKELSDRTAISFSGIDTQEVF